MKEPSVTPVLASELGFTETEYSTISGLLGRIPTYTELRILAVYWSEPCSGRLSNSILKTLTQNGSSTQSGEWDHLSQKVDVGDSAMVVKTSSCYIDPVLDPDSMAESSTIQAIRDIRAMGAQPISIFYSRCTGLLEKRGTKKEIKSLAEGVKRCGKILETQTTASHLVFEEKYTNNSLFNVLVLGVVPEKKLVYPEASGEGNPVFILRIKNETGSQKTTHDLSAEKSLGYVCQELSQRSYLIGLRAISQGGIAIAGIDLAVHGNCGLALNLTKIESTAKTDDMSVYSSDIGQYLVVINKGFEKELRIICQRFNVHYDKIGKINGNKTFTISLRKKVYCSIPLAVFLERTEIPSYQISAKEPAYLIKINKPKLLTSKKTKSWNTILFKLLENLNVLANENTRRNLDVLDSKWNSLFENDRKQTVVFRSWTSGRSSYLDPRTGGKCAVSGATRKVVCRGASPVAASVSVMLGDLQDPEVFYMFKEMIEGIAEACREFQISVVNKDIKNKPDVTFPTPVIGVIGLMDGTSRLISHDFKTPNDFIIMLGSHRGELGGSEYQRVMSEKLEGPPPLVDVMMEQRVYEIVLMLNKVDLLKSACDVSSGGLAVALAHCLIASNDGLGARIHMSSKIREEELLFGETQGLFLITIDEDSLIEIERLCMRIGISCTAIGRVTDDGYFSFNKWIHTKVDKLRKSYSLNLRKFSIFQSR